MLLEDKVAIVTGATSGIGKATVARFRTEGAAVLGTGRNADALAELRASSQDQPGRLVTCEADMSSADGPERIVSAALEAFGNLDVLVKAAAIIDSGTIENTTDEAWDEMFAVNLRGPFRLIRAATPHLVKRAGAIVNISSVTGLRSFPGILAYCASKAGLDHLTRCVALELADRGVRVNAINPGVVVSNLHRRAGFSEEKYSEFLKHSKQTHPLGRPGRPQEIAEAILFLASDLSGWMTGETIALDGGRHLTCAR